MQGIFRKENTDKALKYGIYRHLPTYEKIIRNLVSFSLKNLRVCKVDKRQFFGASIVKATAWIQKNVKFCRMRPTEHDIIRKDWYY